MMNTTAVQYHNNLKDEYVSRASQILCDVGDQIAPSKFAAQH